MIRIWITNSVGKAVAIHRPRRLRRMALIPARPPPASRGCVVTVLGLTPEPRISRFLGFYAMASHDVNAMYWLERETPYG